MYEWHKVELITVFRTIFSAMIYIFHCLKHAFKTMKNSFQSMKRRIVCGKISIDRGVKCIW